MVNGEVGRMSNMYHHGGLVSWRKVDTDLTPCFFPAIFPIKDFSNPSAQTGQNATAAASAIAVQYNYSLGWLTLRIKHPSLVYMLDQQLHV